MLNDLLPPKSGVFRVAGQAFDASHWRAIYAVNVLEVTIHVPTGQDFPVHFGQQLPFACTLTTANEVVAGTEMRLTSPPEHLPGRYQNLRLYGAQIYPIPHLSKEPTSL